MKCVLDSSVAFKFAVIETDSPKAIQLIEEYWQSLHEFLAPEIFPFELAHALTRAERQNRLTPGEAHFHWASVMTAPPTLANDHSLIQRGIEIASIHRIGVYDCVYVALAEQENCDLITADTKLVNNLKKHFPFIIELSTLP